MYSFGPAGIKPGRRFNRKEKSELEDLGYAFAEVTLLLDRSPMWVCIDYTPPESRLPHERGADDSMAVMDRAR